MSAGPIRTSRLSRGSSAPYSGRSSAPHSYRPAAAQGYSASSVPKTFVNVEIVFQEFFMPREVISVPIPAGNELRVWRLVQATLNKLKHSEGRTKLVHIARVSDDSHTYDPIKDHNEVLDASKTYYLRATKSVADATADLTALSTAMGGKSKHHKRRRQSQTPASQKRKRSRRRSQTPHFW